MGLSGRVAQLVAALALQFLDCERSGVRVAARPDSFLQLFGNFMELARSIFDVKESTIVQSTHFGPQPHVWSGAPFTAGHVV